GRQISSQGSLGQVAGLYSSRVLLGSLRASSSHNMDLEQLRKPDLLLMCEELGIEGRNIQRKPLLVKAIQATGADDKEFNECWVCWELIKERREATEQKAKEEREAEERRREVAEQSEMKRLELEMKRLEVDQALLLTLLPCEAAQVVARLCPEEAADYEAVKLGLRKKYRLSAEAFRPRFHGARKEAEDAEVYSNHDGVVECFGLEQLYKGMPEAMRYWVPDTNPDTTQKAA
ncbi:hypothetical protein HPB47_023380, partial [Ixodes persulcatus]